MPTSFAENEFMSMYHKSLDLEEIVYDLLISIGKNNVLKHITINPKQRAASFEVDIQFGTPNNTSIVEIKRYNPHSALHLDRVQNAINRLLKVLSLIPVVELILVISTKTTPEVNLLLTNYPSIQLWDLDRLLKLAEPFPEIYNRILINLELSDVLPLISSKQDVKNGERINSILTTITPGKDEFAKYESTCTEALQYLFEYDLAEWKSQKETIDGLQRLDLICRINRTDSEVWRFIKNNLQSRYVIFEFKNYSEKIQQREIISTERYLYPNAFRKIAIIVSQQGCSESAERVIEGAMREHGKLILSITTQELSNLLLGKDNGDDPNDFLFSKIDNLLMSLGR